MVFIWMKNEPTERHGHHRSFSFVDAVSITRVVVTSRLDSAFYCTSTMIFETPKEQYSTRSSRMSMISCQMTNSTTLVPMVVVSDVKIDTTAWWTRSKKGVSVESGFLLLPVCRFRFSQSKWNIPLYRASVGGKVLCSSKVNCKM
jgi:hypothetical protein